MFTVSFQWMITVENSFPHEIFDSHHCRGPSENLQSDIAWDNQNSVLVADHEVPTTNLYAANLNRLTI